VEIRLRTQSNTIFVFIISQRTDGVYRNTNKTRKMRCFNLFRVQFDEQLLNHEPPAVKRFSWRDA
jgi:hypothetical protein